MLFLQRVVALLNTAKRIEPVGTNMSSEEKVTIEMVIKAKRGMRILEWIHISDSIRGLAIDRGVEAKPSVANPIEFDSERIYTFIGDLDTIQDIRFSLRESFNLNSEILEPVEK